MKNLLAFVISLIMLLSLVACSTTPESTQTTVTDSSTESAPVEASALPEDMPWQDITPLAEKVELNIASMVNTTPHLPTYIAAEKGWLEAVGIEITTVPFTNGPSMMEAVGAGAWDCGSTGIGGVITGILNQDIKVLGVAARDEGGFQAFFAREDNPIVLAGTGHGENPDIYGTAETWMGQEIFCQVGTTNQLLLYITLDNFGLTLDDVNVVNMDSPAANTAFLTGQGDVAGISGPVVFDEDKKDYIMVSSDSFVPTGIVTSFIASPAAWEEKQEAITKWLEVIVMTNEWIEANREEAATYLTQMYEDDGYPSTDEGNLELIKNNPFSILSYQTDIITDNEDGVMKMKQQTLSALEGYVAMGNYTQDQYDTIANSENSFLSEPIEQIAANRQ